MPRYKYTGLNLGQVLSRHGDDLATQLESGQWLSFHDKWSATVKREGPGLRGFLHPHKSIGYFRPELFDSKSDAENDALAKLLHNTEHTGQLSTLPAERRDAVEKRYDKIHGWTEPPKPKKKGSICKGTGKGYRIVRKRGGGTELELRFNPREGFKIDGRSVYKDDRVRDIEKNRDLIEEEHAQNEHVKRREFLGKKKGRTDPNLLFDLTPSPPVGSQVLVRWDGEPGPERDDSWRATVSRDADGELWLVGAQFDPDFGEPIPFDPLQDAWRMAPHAAPSATPWPRPHPQRPAPTRPVPSSTQGPLVNITNSPTDSRAPPKRKAPPPPPPNLDDDATSRGRERRDDARTPPPPAPASTRDARRRAPAAEAPRGGGPPGMTGGDGSDGPWSRLTARTEAGDSIPPPVVGPNDGGDGLAPAPPPKRPKCDEVASSKKVLFLEDVLQDLEGANATAAAAWCDTNGATSMKLLGELADDVLIDAFSTAAGLSKPIPRMAAKKRILELARAAATPRYDAPPPPPSEGPVDGGEDLCERAAPAAPPRRMTAPSQAPPRAAPTPFSLRSDKGNPFMETADDQARYKIDYAAALDLDQCEPTPATRGTYERIAGIFTRKWEALGLGRPPEVKTPCSLLHLPGFNASSAAATRDAFKWAWDKTDGGKLSSLEEALNEYFFELTDLGRLLAEAWAEQAFSDDDWEVVRPMVRVDLVFGGVQAGPEAVVFWPELLSILYKDQTFKEGWQQWIGASRHGTILGALLARTQWQDGRERSGVLPGPTV